MTTRTEAVEKLVEAARARVEAASVAEHEASAWLVWCQAHYNETSESQLVAATARVADLRQKRNDAWTALAAVEAAPPERDVAEPQAGGREHRWDGNEHRPLEAVCADCGQTFSGGEKCPGPLPAEAEKRAEEPTVLQSCFAKLREAQKERAEAITRWQFACEERDAAREALKRLRAERAPAPPAAPGPGGRVIRFVAAMMHADLADDTDGHKRDELVRLGQLAKVEHDTTRAELLDARRERIEAISEAHAAAKENEAMLLTIEKLSAELAKPEDVRLREAVDAMGDRCPQFFSLAGRIDRLLDDVDEWIERAGSAERTVEKQGRLLASTQNIVREIQSAPEGDAHVDSLHSRIDDLVAIAEAAEELCRAVGERAADGDFNPLPQASLTGAVREEIAPHVFRQWAATKAALHRAERVDFRKERP